MLRITIVRTPQGVEALRGAWERLYQDGAYSIFQSPGWNLLAARVFCGRAEPLVIHAEGDGGAAILPACTTTRGISFLGGGLFDYTDVLAAGEEQVLRRAWQQVAVAQQPLSVTSLQGDDARQRWQAMGFTPTLYCPAPGVRRADVSADEFAARHTRSARLVRRLARDGVDFRCHRGDDQRLVRRIYELKARQMAGVADNLFADPARVEFMVAIAALDSTCEIFTLETAGALVAALVTFRDRHACRFYTIYYDRAWAHYSPGVALVFESTRQLLQRALDCDYLTGVQPHKTRFATHEVPLFRVATSAEELARISGCTLWPQRERAPMPLAA